MGKTIIIGGVAGGATAAARLRRLDETATIILVERGAFISFANCGLPYYLSGTIGDVSALTLQTPEGFAARYHVDVRVRQEAVDLDTTTKTVTLRREDGSQYTETYDTVILATGAKPLKPPIEGIDHPKVFTLRTIPDTLAIRALLESRKPKQSIVIGGGYIGVEVAENLAKAGLAVTIVDAQPQVLAPLDYDMACDVHKQLERKGITLQLNTSLKSIHANEDGVTVALSSGTVAADFVVLAIGVVPDTALAAQAKLQLNERGSIIVNELLQTSDPHVYAVGDAIAVTEFVSGTPAFLPLAGPANKQGRMAADNICGRYSVYRGTQGSSIVKLFDMTVAATGLNEKNAKRLGVPYEKSFTYSASHAGYYPGGGFLSIKVLFRPDTGKLLGAQLVGFDGVDKRCDVLATAIRAGMTAYDLTALELCYAPPYTSAKDPVNMAGYAIENILTNSTQIFHWHDVDALPRDGSVTLLDVRTPAEYARGHITGFVNSPLDTLRATLHTLTKEAPVYLHCQIGMRGYLAARILSQCGFTVYNLSGGYRLYQITQNR